MKLTYEQQQHMLLEMCNITDMYTSMIRKMVMEGEMGMGGKIVPEVPISNPEQSLREKLLQKIEEHQTSQSCIMSQVELVTEISTWDGLDVPDQEVAVDIPVQTQIIEHELDMFKRNCEIGDSITLNHKEFGQLEFLVAGKNIDAPRSVTLISKHVITKRNWTTPSGCDRCEYEGSDLRKWLNTDFKNGFEIVEFIKPVRKKTNTLSKSYNERVTLDYCWLLSREECALRSTSGLDTSNCYPVFSVGTDKIRTFRGDHTTDEHVTWFLRENSEYNLEQDATPHVHCVNTLGSFAKLDPMKTKAGVVVGLVI